MNQLLKITFKKKGNKLVITSKLERDQYNIFIRSLDEDAIVEGLLELRTLDNTKSQLAKIHVMIKIMADEQGYSVKEMKEIMKDECGMSYKKEGKKIYESFADKSKDELSNVIETIIQRASFLNINLQDL